MQYIEQASFVDVYLLIDEFIHTIMKIIALLLSVFSFSLGYSQSLPFNFSSTSQRFTAFGGSSFSFDTDPNNANNAVAKLDNDGSDTWQGFTINLVKSINLDFQNTLSLNFYGFDVNSHNVVMKLENGANPDVQVTNIIPAGGGWTDSIVFDFSNAVFSSNGASVDAKGSYSKLTLFIDGGVLMAGSYLVDDISNGTNQGVLDVIYTDLVWSDEFNTPGPVNTVNWHHQTQVIVPGAGWANGELQHYTNRTENSFVDTAGFLHIVAKNESYTDQGLKKDYTSARLNSKYAFTYGRVDIRAKLPLEAGTWPAIWMLGKNINEDGGYWDANHGTSNWPACGEIDIMEHGIFHGKPVDYINSAIHTPCCHGGNPNQGGTFANDLANSFHVYSVNWSPNQITFLLDGVAFYAYNPVVKNSATWPFDKDQFILLNIAMGGIAGNVDPSFTESPMLIDYVRIYQNTPAAINEQASLKSEIQIYPNPAKDYLYIVADKVPTRIALYTLFGKQVRMQLHDTQKIDVKTLPSGVYFLEVLVGQQRVIQKVIIG